MKDLGWSVEEDVFNDETPIGEITFRNIIATHNPKSCKRLVFACHYDSKYFKSGKFLGATDSAGELIDFEGKRRMTHLNCSNSSMCNAH